MIQKIVQHHLKIKLPFTDSSIGFLDKIVNDDTIGDSTFTYSYGGSQAGVTKLGRVSGSNLHSVLRSMGSSGVMSRNSVETLCDFIPKWFRYGGIPTTTTDSYDGSAMRSMC